VTLSLANSLVQDRLEGTGMLTTRTARDHGVLGYVGRASGSNADVRRDTPSRPMESSLSRARLRVRRCQGRTLVRVEEARESVADPPGRRAHAAGTLSARLARAGFRARLGHGRGVAWRHPSTG